MGRYRCIYYCTLLLIFILHAVNTMGQNNTNSPYSLFGVGLLQNKGFGCTQAMGGTGIGMQSNEYLNIVNPASYSAIDSGSVHFDFGTHFQYSIIRDAYDKHDFINGNLSYLAAGLPLGNRWSLGFSLIPLSNVGYNISIDKLIEGTYEPIQLLSTGTGGLSQLSLVSSFDILTGLSVGLSTGYIFGSIDLNRKIKVNQTETVLVTDEKQNYHGWTFDFGLQFSRELREGTILTFGGVFRPGTFLSGTYSLDVVTPSDSTTEEKNLSSMLIPPMYGAGISVDLNSKLTWGIDYSMTCWSAASDSYLDNTVISSGLEWLPDRENFQYYWKRVSYRIGARCESGYLVVEDTPIRSYAGTFGVGLPIRNFKNRINLTLEMGRMGTLENSLIREDYCRLFLNINLQDIWFRKNKYN